MGIRRVERAKNQSNLLQRGSERCRTRVKAQSTSLDWSSSLDLSSWSVSRCTDTYLLAHPIWTNVQRYQTLAFWLNVDPTSLDELSPHAKGTFTPSFQGVHSRCTL